MTARVQPRVAVPGDLGAVRAPHPRRATPGCRSGCRSSAAAGARTPCCASPAPSSSRRRPDRAAARRAARGSPRRPACGGRAWSSTTRSRPTASTTTAAGLGADRATRRGSPTRRGRPGSCRRSASSVPAATRHRSSADAPRARNCAQPYAPAGGPLIPTIAAAGRRAARRRPAATPSPRQAPSPRDRGEALARRLVGHERDRRAVVVDEAQRRGVPRHAAAGVRRAVERVDHDDRAVAAAGSSPLSSDSTREPGCRGASGRPTPSVTTSIAYWPARWPDAPRVGRRRQLRTDRVGDVVEAGSRPGASRRGR